VAGVTAIELTVLGVTVSAAIPLTLPTLAVIVDVPAATPVARPAVLMVAVAVLELVQVADVLTFAVDPSL
jgi:hypothetical protein